MSLLVVIPWRETPERRPLLDQVLDNLSRFAPPLLALDRDPFSRSRAINNAVRSHPGDLILINDADCICPPEQITRALALALDLPGPVFAFTDYVRLGPDGSEERSLRTPPSGSCLAIRRADFNQVGGYDERFEGWGYEDVAFNAACARHWPPRRIPGPVYHLYHGERRDDDSPVSEDPALIARNLALFEKEYRG